MLPDLDSFLKRNRAAQTLAVYDGQRLAGTVAEVGGEHVAFDSSGHGLGAFKKRQEAVAAIPALSSTGGTPAPASTPGSA